MLIVVIAQQRDAVQDTRFTPHPVQVLAFWFQAHTSALKDLTRRAFKSSKDFSVTISELLYNTVMEVLTKSRFSVLYS